jgi:sarcosine oxidase subunit alpha
VRQKAGFVDVSTLGKIDLQGRDAAAFLEKIYINRWRNLPIGRCRYGLMLREDGFILDDGTTTRIGASEYYMTTTTAHAAQVLAHLEFYAQTVWPELQVQLTSVTDQWAAVALAGPHARDVLAKIVDRVDVSDAGLPYLGYREASISGIPARLFRITFSGERAYEIHVPADYGTALCAILLEAGQSWDIAPYGTEAMNILRIEKGYVTHAELDGRTIPADLGFAHLQRADDFIGKRALERPALNAEGRETLVGLIATDGQPIPRGAHLIAQPAEIKPHPLRHSPSSNPTLPDKLGHVTSRCYSPHVGRHIALALLRDGHQRLQQALYAAAPLDNACVPVTVTGPVFVDPTGARARG